MVITKKNGRAPSLTPAPWNVKHSLNALVQLQQNAPKPGVYHQETGRCSIILVGIDYQVVSPLISPRVETTT